MRVWFSGPRIFGIRPGISFGREDFRRRGWTAAQPRLVAESVYVITGAHGLVKIGISSDPVSRLATLQTASPFPLHLAYQIPVQGSAFAVEQEAHGILARQRQSGEWFATPVEVAIAAIHSAAYRVGAPIGGMVVTEIEAAAPNRLRRMFLSLTAGVAAFFVGSQWMTSDGSAWPFGLVVFGLILCLVATHQVLRADIQRPSGSILRFLSVWSGATFAAIFCGAISAAMIVGH